MVENYDTNSFMRLASNTSPAETFDCHSTVYRKTVHSFPLVLSDFGLDCRHLASSRPPGQESLSFSASYLWVTWFLILAKDSFGECWPAADVDATHL